ncbi:hypothetical protein MUN78_04365 [Leucobacter allii]|uniref:Uncharacterized protein n=1 Tax=Leucobacter allii TaxID=2932247 RepID=A0ABY4FP70_9MICO|nr:hypothetical protein [Leucobacter allii]UOQ58085.1 hypothetical protein MUN78_04365 [Leucobacter allii]
MNIQSVRTYIAALVGVLLLRLVAAVPAIAAVIDWIDGVFLEAGLAGASALALVTAAITAAAVLAYQKAAQWFGDRWPHIEKWMLGSSARPTYDPEHAAE